MKTTILIFTMLLLSCTGKHLVKNKIKNHENTYDCYSKNSELSTQTLCLNFFDSTFVFTIRRSLLSFVACGNLSERKDSSLILIVDTLKTDEYISNNLDKDYVLFPYFDGINFKKTRDSIRLQVNRDYRGDSCFVEYSLFKE